MHAMTTTLHASLRALAFACLDFDAVAPDALLQAWFATTDASERAALAAGSPLAARHLYAPPTIQIWWRASFF